jgi:amino acid adenylation domain-containing protein
MNPDESIPRLFERQVALNPERIAVKSRDEAYTYRRLNEAANRVARALVARHGNAAEPVALLLDSDAAMIVAALGVLKTGRFYVPLDPAYPFPRTAFMLSDSGAGIVITDERHRHLALAFTERILDLAELAPTLSGENPAWPVAPDAAALLLYTSGSMGRPKGVLHDHRSLAHQGMRYAQALRITAEDRHSQLHSLNYAASMKHLFGALLNGAGLYLYNLRQAGLAPLAAWLNRERITVCGMVTTAFRRFLDSLEGTESFPWLRVMCAQAEPLYWQDVKSFHARFPAACRLIHEMGASEIGPILYNPLDRSVRPDQQHVPVGFPFEGIRIRLADPSGNPVGENEPGELVVQSRYLARCYWNNAELSQRTFRPDPGGGPERLYSTGDLVRRLPDGAIEHLGRKDAQVKIRGHRVAIGEVEGLLLTHPAVHEAAVAARQSRRGEYFLTAYLVARNPTPPKSELRRWLAERLPEYMIPSGFVFVDTLPLTPSGKLDQGALTGRPAALDDSPLPAAPRDPLESRLADLWRNLLELPAVGIHDNFFDIGGDSLRALALVVQLEKEWSVPLPTTALIEAPTIALLANRMRRSERDPGLSHAVRFQKGGRKTPLFLIHTLDGGVFKYRELVGLLGPDQPVWGILPQGSDGKEQPACRMENIAAFDIEVMRRIQPSGPYCVAGYCFGGAVAFEIARQLHRQGERLGLVAMFEVLAPRPPGHGEELWRPWAARRFLRNLPLWIEQSLPQQSRYLTQRIRIRLAGEIRSLLRRLGKPGGPARRRLEPEDYFGNLAAAPEAFRNMLQTQFLAFQAYDPEPFPGRITLIRARALPLFRPCDPEMGWGRLALGGVEVKIISGSHLLMLQRPQVESLGAALKASLNFFERAIRLPAGIMHTVQPLRPES